MDLFKNAAQAGREVRRLGQVSPDDDRDPALTMLSESASAGMRSVESPQFGLRRPQAQAPQAQSLDAIRESFISERSSAPAEAAQEDPFASIRDSFFAERGQEQGAAPAEPESDGTLLGDLTRSLGRGAISMGSGIYELGNIVTGGGLDNASRSAFGTSGTEAIGAARQSLNQADSAELQRQRQELERAEGFWSSFGTVLTNPRLLGSMAVEAGPQMATIALTAKRMAVGKFASVLDDLVKKGMPKAEAVKAAQVAAGKSATYTVMGMNAALEAGMAGSDIRNEVLTMSEADLQPSPQYQALLKQFGDTEEGRALARQRIANDASTTAALVTAPISAVSSFLFRGGAEGDIARRTAQSAIAGKIGAQATRPTVKEALKGIAGGAGREFAEEAGQEGGSEFSQNVGALTSGADPDRDLFEGVPQAAGAGGALGLVMGGATNVRIPRLSDSDPAAPQTPGNTQGTPQGSGPAGDPEIRSGAGESVGGLAMSDNEFARTMENPRALPFIAALYDQASEGLNQETPLQTQLAEIVRRYNPTITNLREELERNPDLVSQGYQILETAPESFVSMFLGSVSTQVVKPDTTPLPPRVEPKTDEELQKQYDEDVAPIERGDAAIASAQALGIEPRTKEEPTEEAISLDLRRQGYQRRAQNQSRLPPGARRAAATSSITDMIADGFTAEQAEAVFGPLLQEDQATEVPAEATQQTTRATEQIAATNIGDAGATADLPGSAPGVSVVPQTVSPRAPSASSQPAAVPLGDTPGFALPGTISTDNGVFVVKNAPTGKKRADDTPVHAFVSRKGKVISIDGNAVRAQFADLAWTEPKLEGVIALPADAFANADEWLEFVFRHEVAHINEPRIPGEATPDYENRINRIALTQMKGEAYAAQVYDVPNEGTNVPNEGTPVEAATEQQAVTEPVTNVTETVTEEAPKTEGTNDDLVKAEYIKLFAEQAQATADMTPADRSTRLKSLAKDMQGLGFTKEEAASVLRGVREEVDQDLKTRKVPFGLDIEDESKSAPPTTKRESEVFEGGNPNVTVGTTEAPPKEPDPEVAARDARRKELPNYIQYNISSVAVNNSSLSPREIAEKQMKIELEYRLGLQMQERARKWVKATGAKFTRPKPKVFKQATPEQKKLYAYMAKARKIALGLNDPTQQQRALEAFRAFVDRSRKNRRKNAFDDDKGGVFSEFARTGAFGSDGYLELALKLNAQEDEKYFKNRISYLEDEAAKSQVSRFLLNAELIVKQLELLGQAMQADGIDAKTVNELLGPQIEQLKNINEELLALANEQISETSTIPAEDRTKAPEDFGPTEEAESDATPDQIADRLVASILEGEVTSTRALTALEAEARASGISLQDLQEALRRANLPQNVFDYQSEPAFNYSYDYYVNRDKGTPRYVAEARWFSSLAKTARNIRNSDGDQAAEDFMNSFKVDEPQAFEMYQRWRKRRADIVRGVRNANRTEGGKFLFQTIDDAFPNALFNLYPLSVMNDLTKAKPEDQAVLLSIARMDPESLRNKWFEDFRDAKNARPDMESQFLDLLSDAEFKQYQAWRGQQIRALITKANILAKSGEANQLFQLYDSLGDEMYGKFARALHVASANQKAAILSTAAQIAEKREIAKETGTDASSEIEELFDQVFSQDEAVSTDPDVIEAEVQSQSEKLNVSDDGLWQIDDNGEVVSEDGQRFDSAEDQAAPDSDPSDFIDRFRTKNGRYSGAVSAATVFDHINEITSKWDKAPHFEVLNNINQLPESIRQYAIKKLGGQSAKGLMAPDGAIYIFSDFVENVEDAEFVFFHELYGHYGLRAFLGSKLNPFLESQYRLNKTVRAEADRVIAEAEAAGRQMSQAEAAEEAISDLATKQEELTTFQKIVVSLQKFLRSIGMNPVADWMESLSHADLAFVLSQARKAVREGRMGPMNGAPSDFRFAASTLPVEIFATNAEGRTSAYAVYNPITNNWTVYYNKAGLDATNFSIQTLDNYTDALNLMKVNGKIIRVKDHPRRMDKAPGDFPKKPVPDFSNETGWKKWMRMAQQTIQSKYMPIYRTVRWMREQGYDVNLDNVIKLFAGKLRPIFTDFRINVLRPMAKILNTLETSDFGYTFRDDKGSPVDYKGLDLVELYALAKHAPERNAEILKRDPKNSSGSGISTKEALKIVRDLDNSPVAQQLQEASLLLQKLSKDKLAIALRTGWKSETAIRAMSDYSFYVNLSGNNDPDSVDFVDKNSLGGANFNVGGDVFKFATGRATMAKGILENTLNGYLTMAVRGQKNVVMQSVLQLVMEVNDPNFAVINPVFQVRELDFDKMVADKMFYRTLGENNDYQDGKKKLMAIQAKVEANQLTPSEAAAEIYQEFQMAHRMGRISGKQLESLSKRLESAFNTGADGRIIPLGKDGYIKDVAVDASLEDKDTVMVRVNGKPVLIKFTQGADDGNNKFGTFVSALKGMNSTQMPMTLEGIGWINRGIGQLITSRNPTWIPVNWIRDIGVAHANAAADPRVGPKVAAKISMYAPRAYRVMMNHIMGEDYVDKNSFVYRFIKKVASTKLSDREQRYIKEFFDSGAPVFFMDRKDMKEQLTQMQRELNPRGGVMSTWDDYAKFTDFLGVPSELSARFSTYMNLREEGWTIEEAAVYTKEITVNFEQKGSSRWITTTFMFANPSIQGTVRMFKDALMTDKNGNKRVNPQFLKVASALMALGMVTSFFARSMGANDDDELPNELDTIARYKRATQIVLFPGTNLGSPFFMPYGWNAYFAAGVFLPDSLVGDTPWSTTIDRITASAFDAFWPLGQSESSGAISTLFKLFVPTPLSPLLDVSFNESRFGGPITKGDNQFVRAEEAASWSNFSNASPISVAMARKINEITGGNQYRSGSFLGVRTDWNPDIIDYLAGSYLPGPFAETGRLSNALINTALGKDVKNIPIPLVDRFGSKGREKNPGWDTGAYRRAQTYVQTAYKEATTVDEERKQEILKDHPNLGNAKAGLDAIDRNIRSIRSNLRAIENNRLLSSKEKIEARNQSKKLEEAYYADAVRIAIKSGFKDQVLADQ